MNNSDNGLNLISPSNDFYEEQELIDLFEKYTDIIGKEDVWSDKESLLDFFRNLKLNKIGMVHGNIIESPTSEILKIAKTVTKECMEENNTVGFIGLDGFIYSDKNKFVKEKCLTVVNKNGIIDPESGKTTAYLIYSEAIDSGVFKFLIDYTTGRPYFSFFTNDEIMEGYEATKNSYPVGFDRYKFEFTHGLDYPKVLKTVINKKTHETERTNNQLVSNLPTAETIEVEEQDRSKFTNMVNQMGLLNVYQSFLDGKKLTVKEEKVEPTFVEKEEIKDEKVEEKEQFKPIIEPMKEQPTEERPPETYQEEPQQEKRPVELKLDPRQEMIARIGELENEEKMLTDRLLNVVGEKAQLKLKLKLQELEKNVVQAEANKIMR